MPHPTLFIFNRRCLGAAVLVILLALWAAQPGAASALQGTPLPPTPASAVEAVVAVERAVVFPRPDRNAEALTYLFQREQAPVLGQTPDGSFLLVAINNESGSVQGWILRAQVDITGDLAQVPVISVETLPLTPTLTFTPFVASLTPGPLNDTPFPAQTSVPAGAATQAGTPDVSGTPTTAPPILKGTPPPLEITLPDGWNAAHMQIPYRTLQGETRYIPLTVYFGPLSGGTNGFIYLYWGFPGVVNLATGEHNLWADGVQMLRGSLVGDACNLGVYDQQTFSVGGQEGVGAFYQASDCKNESDTAGWFTTVNIYDGNFAFYTAVEPWSSLSDQRAALQAILDSVKFLSPEEK